MLAIHWISTELACSLPVCPYGDTCLRCSVFSLKRKHKLLSHGIISRERHILTYNQLGEQVKCPAKTHSCLFFVALLGTWSWVSTVC